MPSSFLRIATQMPGMFPCTYPHGVVHQAIPLADHTVPRLFVFAFVVLLAVPAFITIRDFWRMRSRVRWLAAFGVLLFTAYLPWLPARIVREGGCEDRRAVEIAWPESGLPVWAERHVPENGGKLFYRLPSRVWLVFALH